MERFSDWLLKELKSRNMSQADLAHASGLGRGTISNIMTGTRKVGQDSLLKISSALRIPPETVFQMAGVFPGTPRDALIDEITYLARQLPAEDVVDLIDLARAKIARYEGRATNNLRNK